ncbi:MAG: thermonuclease family protein [Sphaerospermopsis sp. SIO1G1]|nr:thermonuclease family protein [Sphaerospermopsis sp. SIO1G1]
MNIVPRCKYPQGKIAALVPHLGIWARNMVILFCLLLLVSCQNKNQPTSLMTEVKLARVVSGQTLEVIGMGKQPNLISPVRLIGLNAPDLGQRPWGYNAKEMIEKLIGNGEKTIQLEFDIKNKDKFGRNLAYVWKDKMLLNEQVIKQGYALFTPRSPNHKYDKRLENAQHWARIMGKGIWNPEKPMRLTPSEFRRMYR